MGLFEEEHNRKLKEARRVETALEDGIGGLKEGSLRPAQGLTRAEAIRLGEAKLAPIAEKRRALERD